MRAYTIYKYEQLIKPFKAKCLDYTPPVLDIPTQIKL